MSFFHSGFAHIAVSVSHVYWTFRTHEDFRWSDHLHVSSVVIRRGLFSGPVGSLPRLLGNSKNIDYQICSVRGYAGESWSSLWARWSFAHLIFTQRYILLVTESSALLKVLLHNYKPEEFAQIEGHTLLLKTFQAWVSRSASIGHLDSIQSIFSHKAQQNYSSKQDFVRKIL